MSSWDDYRSTGKGFALEMARVPGEMSLVFGLFSLNPLLILGGLAEIAVCWEADSKAYDAFMKKGGAASEAANGAFARTGAAPATPERQGKPARNWLHQPA